MTQTITIRLTPGREQLLKGLKKRFNVKKNFEAIDLALRMCAKDDLDFRSRLEHVAGCITLKGRKTAVQKIRTLRDGNL